MAPPSTEVLLLYFCPPPCELFLQTISCISGNYPPPLFHSNSTLGASFHRSPIPALAPRRYCFCQPVHSCVIANSFSSSNSFSLWQLNSTVFQGNIRVRISHTAEIGLRHSENYAHSEVTYTTAQSPGSVHHHPSSTCFSAEKSIRVFTPQVAASPPNLGSRPTIPHFPGLHFPGIDTYRRRHAETIPHYSW